MNPARLGVFGGTFDPIHLGHLDAARAARRAMGLDRVVFVPSHVPPHRDLPHASGYHRFAMVALAITGDPAFVVSDSELSGGGRSYTVRTLRAFRASGWAPSQIFFITGMDAFAEIATWHDYPAVLDAAQFVVVSRPGYSRAVLDEKLPALLPRIVDLDTTAQPRERHESTGTSVFLVAAPTADISSTEIRERLLTGKPLDGLLAPAVADYARRHHLYVPAPSAAGQLHGEE